MREMYVKAFKLLKNFIIIIRLFAHNIHIEISWKYMSRTEKAVELLQLP